MDSVMLTLHLFGIIFFVGGQMAMIAAVTPSLRSKDADPSDQLDVEATAGAVSSAKADALRQIATRFGIGSAIALLVIIGSGTSMAIDNHLWGEPILHAKLGILAVIFVLTALHTKVPYTRVLSLSIFVLSLVLVVLGVQLSQV